MNDEIFITIIVAAIGVMGAVLSYDMGQRSKEQDCTVLGRFTVRQSGLAAPAVYTCKRAE